MNAFPLHTLDSAPEGARDLLGAVQAHWGFVPNLHAILAESPLALAGYESLFGLVQERASLAPVERQAAFLAVSVFHGCAYCTMGHTFLARQAGMEAADLDALRAGGRPVTVHLAALAVFTRKLLETRGDAGPAVLADFLAAGFTRAQVLEVVAIIATKTISNYVNHITATPHEDFMADPALSWSAGDAVAAPAGGA
ncbi:carboxymuconolactone decarboxylase family protein [Stappia sp. MMSF_3263]|uniref:carboxymuconolactone decarboxylase family protein n=1 Tax=Stappia sp. MMSF_3263 TaxID=3046693 RepID=UPI00273F53DD|nr:carboxymuconolactone decarboxylase family protein [Stappia sp. MMSF_3263]